jgi:N-carbamoyl-L-amino-acid hydrolase
MDAQLQDFIIAVSQESGLGITLEQVSHYPAAPADARCQQSIGRAAQQLGYPSRPIISGAGHDAVYMSYWPRPG